MAYLAYAEIVGEEQRRMTQFMPRESSSGDVNFDAIS